MNPLSDLKANIRDVEGLQPYLLMNEEEQRQMGNILEQFPLSVPPYYLSLIRWEDPDDPIRKMCIPSIAETDLSGSFDTSGEADNTVVEGLQHKYAETAMILSTNQCAMYCRHCFRKRLVGLSDGEIAKNFGKMEAYIREHTEITNVLVSGGDSMLNSNDRLRSIFSMLVGIGHLDAIRLASRVPVVYPQRITGDEELQQILAEAGAKKQLIFVTQFNHPRELTEQSCAALKTLLHMGIPVKNQTVLLRGVNDDPAVLGRLLRGLIATGVSPYYVFQCRPVSGVKNQFQVPMAEGVKIVEAAKAMQNGLGKALRYCMSHVSGKLEILGNLNGEMLFRYHEAQNPANLGRLFTQKLSEGQTWLNGTT